MSSRLILTLADVQNVSAGTDQQDEPRTQDAAKLRDLVAELRATQNGGTSLDVKIQDSFDGGATWNDWISFAQLTSDGAEPLAPTRPPGGDLRVLRTSIGNGWDYRVKLSGNPLA